MHPNCAFVFARYARSYVHGRVLEIGPEASATTLKDLSRGWTAWHTADICAGTHLTFPECDPYDYPVATSSFDTIVSANVLEHVREPWTWMKELKRIVKPGGHIIVVTPANWVFHPDPVDCWRVWPDGLAALFSWAGLVPLVTLAVGLDPGMDWVVDTVGVGRC